MRNLCRALPLALFYALLTIGSCVAECVPFTEAAKHVGETRCIKGQVVRVEQGNRGVHYLDFCQDYRLCPFTVVVFASDLRHVGDVRHLAGQSIEVHGHIREYNGRPEIILREARQLSGEAANIPPLPKTYDVERRGNYSAGTITRSKSTGKTPQTKQKAKYPTDVPRDLSAEE